MAGGIPRDRRVLEVSSLSLSFSDYLPTSTYLSIFYVFMYLSIDLSMYLSFSHFVRNICVGRFAIRNFTSVFRNTIKPHFVRKGCDRTREIAILPVWRSNLISCEKGCARTREIAILHQFLAIELHVVRKGCTGPEKSHFFGDRTLFLAKGLHRTREIAILLQIWRSNLVSCERVAPDPWSRNFTSVFGDRTSFRAKGLRPDPWNRNFTSVFGDRTSFRAKGLRFVRSRWHCPASSREK